MAKWIKSKPRDPVYEVYTMANKKYLGDIKKGLAVVTSSVAGEYDRNALQYLLDQHRLGIRKLHNKLFIIKKGDTKLNQRVKLSDLL